MTIIRTTYRQIRRPVSVAGICDVCGKHAQRSRTFSATLNPFNRDPLTGSTRTAPQIREMLAEEAKAWQAKTKPRHQKCESHA